jgi:dihydrofolate reductase
LEEAIKSAEEHNMNMGLDNEIIIIGGGHLFKETSSSVNKLVITRVDCNVAGDIYYPEISLSDWKKISSESYKKDEYNEYNFKIEEYLKL